MACEEEVQYFFRQKPEALALYRQVEQALEQHLGAFDIVVQKTQITFRTTGVIGVVSLPRSKREHPACLVVSFGLDHREDSPRIWQAVEPYPGRWTHHVLVRRAEELDEELLGWLYLSKLWAEQRTQGKKRRKPSENG